MGLYYSGTALPPLNYSPPPHFASPPPPLNYSPPPYFASPPAPISYMPPVPSPANHRRVNMATCSVNTSTKSNANISADYMPFYMATCSAKCSASCAANRSVSCSANCSAPNFGDCFSSGRNASPVNHLAPHHWVWLFFFTTFSNCLTLACYGVFSCLIALDVLRAIKKRATWLPAKAFSLSGVTVLIIVWWTSVSSIDNKCKKEVGVNESVVLHQLVLSGKVAVCVFIGYLLPGMASSSVTTFLALGLSICIQITSELLIFHKHHNVIPKELDIILQQNHTAIPKPHDYNGWTLWANVANSMLLLCFIVLGLILLCTILASQTIHDLLKQRTSAIFSITKDDKRTTSVSWADFDDEVLMSWLAARVCQTDYVISRSVFSSAVGVVITLCVILSFLSNTFHNIYFSDRPFAPIDFGIFSLLFSFIIIGWIIICWRWFASQLYFRSHKQSWKDCLSIEDFWTRNTVELIHMYDLKRERQQFFKMQTSNSTMCSKLQRLPTRIFTKVKLHKVVHLGLMLQLSVVFFSKLCALLSEFIIGNFAYFFRTHTRNGHLDNLPESYNSILELICMPGEKPSDLWNANEMAYNQAKGLLQKGCEKGKSSEEINSNFSLQSQQWKENGKQLLNELQNLALPSVLKHFPSIEKQSVRITAVSLIKIFIELHMPNSDPSKKDMKPEAVRKVMKDCDKVWDMLRFADECDIDLRANEISLLDDLQKDKDQVGMAAETEFYKLQMEYDKAAGGEECVVDVNEGRRILEALLMECEEFLGNENLFEGKSGVNLSDSKNWMEIAPRYNLYKLCKLMLRDREIRDFVALTGMALKNFIACCMSMLPDMLVKQCWKWAQEFEEDKLWEAIDLAGKCRGIMEARQLTPEFKVNAIKQKTIQEEQSV